MSAISLIVADDHNIIRCGLWALFGFLRLLLAVPLLALIMITTRTLYVENVIDR